MSVNSLRHFEPSRRCEWKRWENGPLMMSFRWLFLIQHQVAAMWWILISSQSCSHRKIISHFVQPINWLVNSPPPLKSPLSLTFPQCSGQLKDTFWWKTQRLPPSTGTRECSGASYSAGAQLPTLLTDSGPAVSSAVIDPAPQNRPLRALLHLRFKGSLIRTAFLILQE